MIPSIDYITIPAAVLLRRDLSDKAKLLLGLVMSFNTKGLGMSNSGLAKILCCSEDHVSRIITEIKDFVRVENPQSRWRRIFYSVANAGVEANTLRHTGRSKNDSTPTSRLATPTSTQATPAPMPDRIKDNINNKRARPNENAQDNFLKIKSTAGMPGDFLDWFEREVLGRFEKYLVSEAILGDWLLLYKKFGRDDLAAAVQNHRQETERWEPSLQAIKKYAEKITVERIQQVRIENKRLEAMAQKEAAVKKESTWLEGDIEELAGRYRATKNPLEKVLIQKNRPDVMKIIHSQKTEKGVSNAV